MLRNGDGPVVMLRADMDALPVTEATGLPYASKIEGVFQVCGHDLHVAYLMFFLPDPVFWLSDLTDVLSDLTRCFCCLI